MSDPSKRSLQDANASSTTANNQQLTESVAKRARVDPQNQIVAVQNKQESIIIRPDDLEKGRTSQIQAPIMLLSGHAAATYTLNFAPSGRQLATAGKDKTILIWNVYGDCENTAMLTGHKNAILDLHWSGDNSRICTASADKTVGIWDVEACKRVKTYKSHEGIVNSCDIIRRGPIQVCSASDDGTVKVYDARQRGAATTLTHTYPLTAAAFSDDGQSIFSGSVDNCIAQWDLRQGDVVRKLSGHSDTISDLKVSPNGNFLLSNSMDGTLRKWDVRAYVKNEQQRCQQVFHGARNDFEKLLLHCSWSPDGERVAAGSADRLAYVWKVNTGEVQYALPGHDGTVTSVVFHPFEPILGSCATDRQVYLGEIASH